MNCHDSIMRKKHKCAFPAASSIGAAGGALCLLYMLASFVLMHPNITPRRHMEAARASGFNPALVVSFSKPLRRSHRMEVDNPYFQMGPCEGSVARLIMPDSVCAPLRCIRSSVFPDVFVDVANRGLEVLMDAHIAPLSCSEPSGGQIGRLPSSHSAPATQIQVSFIVPFRDNIDMTLQTLLELFRTSREAVSVEFILIDEASTANTSDIEAFGRNLEYLFRIPFTLIRNKSPLGFGSAINLGVHQAVGQYVVPFNNDALPTRGWLHALLFTFQEFPKTGIAGPLLLWSHGTVAEAGGLVYANGEAANYGRNSVPDRRHLFSRPVDYISAACIMLRRSTWLQINGFNPVYGIGYYEDTDLAMAVQQAGLNVQYQPYSVVIHDEGGSLSKVKERLMEANHQIYINRWKHRLSTMHCPRFMSYDDASVRAAGASRMLWIDDIVPEPDHDSGSIRTLNMLRILRSLGFYIMYQPMVSAGRLPKYTAQARAIGIDVLPVVPTNLWNLTIGGRCRYDAIVIARFYIYEQVYETVRRACPDTVLIFDTVDVHFLRETRDALSSTTRWQFHTMDNLVQWMEGNNSDKANAIRARRDRETLAAASASYTFVVSDQEVPLLHRFRPSAKIQVVSNIHDFNRAAMQPRDCAVRSGILFIGNFNHPPNQQAVEALIDDILPLLKAALPAKHDMVLHLVGSNRNIAADWKHAAIPTVFHGYLTDEELKLLYRRVKVVVAPLMSGAGVKGKINQAMLFGVPVVATPVAAEGMHLKDGENSMVATTPEEFTQKLLRVYSDCALWEKLVLGGFDNIDTYFSMSAATAKLGEAMYNMNMIGPHMTSHKCSPVA